MMSILGAHRPPPSITLMEASFVSTGLAVRFLHSTL